MKLNTPENITANQSITRQTERLHQLKQREDRRMEQELSRSTRRRTQVEARIVHVNEWVQVICEYVNTSQSTDDAYQQLAGLLGVSVGDARVFWAAISRVRQQATNNRILSGN